MKHFLSQLGVYPKTTIAVFFVYAILSVLVLTIVEELNFVITLRYTVSAILMLICLKVVVLAFFKERWPVRSPPSGSNWFLILMIFVLMVFAVVVVAPVLGEGVL